jgi:hypothetical protein
LAADPREPGPRARAADEATGGTSQPPDPREPEPKEPERRDPEPPSEPERREPGRREPERREPDRREPERRDPDRREPERRDPEPPDPGPGDSPQREPDPREPESLAEDSALPVEGAGTEIEITVSADLADCPPAEAGAETTDGEAPADAPAEKTSAREREKLEERMAEKAASAPTGPGVYIFKDRRGKALYVGKAKNLRDRVRSYIRGGDGRYQVTFLMDRAADFETLVTVSETEALILENNLIKQYKPRYNIKLMDDKSYVSVKVTVKDAWPRILVTRKIERDGSLYLGPYASASGIRETLEIARKVFPLRTCSDAVFRNRSRPCLEYQIKRCLAPCVLPIDRTEYDRQLKGAIQLLEGKTDALADDLRDAMVKAAEEERYEDAARIRDRIDAVGKVAEKQKALVHGGGDRDVFGFYREGGYLEAQVLFVRAGKLVGNNSYRLEDFEFPDEEVISALTGRFYEGDRYIPEEVLLPLEFEGAGALAEYLTGLRKTRWRSRTRARPSPTATTRRCVARR